MDLAPVIIFTYRRKINKLIQSLLKNKLSMQSELFIFSDGYKNDADKEDVLSVRENLKGIIGFKSITIKEYQRNNGLANSVINGVTDIINKYEKVIVLEDDLIVADNFLHYMNEALSFYENDKDVWSISGYTPTLNCLKHYDKDIYLSRRANSWGWATWKNRWDTIDWDIKGWDTFRSNKKAIKAFNKGGNDMFKMLEAQMLGKIDSWAIRWCYNQFKHNTFTIYPKESKLINIGFDDKGTHNSTGHHRWSTVLSNTNVNFEHILEDDKIISCFNEKYNLHFKTKIGYLLKKYGGYTLGKKITKLIK